MTHIARAGRFGAITLAALMAVAACGAGASTAPATTAPVAVTTPPAATGTPGASGTAATSGAPVTYRCSKGDGQLNGAGSTFINPLLTKMAGDYLAKCGVQINYQSIGSGGGVKAWQQNTVDFGASDAYLADSEISTAAANGTP
ncbi:MAG: substrate-binding domain-containing protein, partial [Candidatus Limnocylindrales bacterium]